MILLSHTFDLLKGAKRKNPKRCGPFGIKLNLLEGADKHLKSLLHSAMLYKSTN